MMMHHTDLPRVMDRSEFEATILSRTSPSRPCVGRWTRSWRRSL